MEKTASLGLFYPLILDNKVEELPATSVLHDQVELLRRLDNLIQLNDVWVSDQLEYVNFSGYSLYIANILNLLFLKDLNSHFLSSQVVIS